MRLVQFLAIHTSATSLATSIAHTISHTSDAMSASTPLTIDPDLEKQQEQYPQKQKKPNLIWDPTLKNTIAEWKAGNKKRVIKYVVLESICGIIVGLAIVLPILLLNRK